MGRVCDRCKSTLDTNRISNLAGKQYDLCTNCADYIANHIDNYKPKQKGFMERVFAK